MWPNVILKKSHSPTTTGHFDVKTHPRPSPDRCIQAKTALEELANIPSGRNTNLADTAMFNVRAPHEFIGMRDNVIEALARDELDYAQGSQQADPNSVYIEQLEAS